MERVKEIFSFIKEKLQNKRTRAMTILGLYFIFFALLFFLIGIGSNTKQSTLETPIIENNKYSNLNYNYSYNYNVEIQTTKEVNKYIITGKYFNNETNYKITKLINNEYVEINSFDLINKDMLYIENILRYINNKEYEYQTKYKSDGILENYKVPILDIDKNYKGNKEIEINIESNDNFISRISFDSTELDKSLNNEITIAKYTLEYKKDE